MSPPITITAGLKKLTVPARTYGRAASARRARCRCHEENVDDYEQYAFN
jgi:hypothetical protein